MRKIIHVDMDAFFASVEQLDHPELRGRPLVVGGDPEGRGVVAACSYEARKYGIRSAMSCAQARRRCPHAVFVRPRKERYQEISRRIMEIFSSWAREVEPLSLDEAFLDVTENPRNIASATWIAQAVRREIFQKTGLTASAGVSCNKFLAKIASDMDKPDGLTVIPPERARQVLHGLPIGKFYGVGRVTRQRMHALGIEFGRDLLRYSRAELVHHFGKAGSFFYDIVRGRDDRPVCGHRQRKSVGSETTLTTDIDDITVMAGIITDLAGRVSQALTGRKLAGRTVTLKVRYDDFVTVTRSRTCRVPLDAAPEIARYCFRLLDATQAGTKKVRLLGVSVSNLLSVAAEDGICFRQLSLPFPLNKQSCPRSSGGKNPESVSVRACARYAKGTIGL